MQQNALKQNEQIITELLVFGAKIFHTPFESPLAASSEMLLEQEMDVRETWYFTVAKKSHKQPPNTL